MAARKGPLYEEGAVTEGDWGSLKNFSPLIACGGILPQSVQSADSSP